MKTVGLPSDLLSHARLGVYSRGHTRVSPSPLDATMSLETPGVYRPNQSRPPLQGTFKGPLSGSVTLSLLGFISTLAEVIAWMKRC